MEAEMELKENREVNRKGYCRQGGLYLMPLCKNQKMSLIYQQGDLGNTEGNYHSWSGEPMVYTT